MEKRRTLLIGLVFLLCTAATPAERPHLPTLRSHGPAAARTDVPDAGTGAAALAAIQQQRVSRLTTFVGAARSFAEAARSARLVDASQLQRPMSKSKAMSILSAAPQPSPSPGAGPAEATALRRFENLNASSGDVSGIGSGTSSPTFNSADGSVIIFAAKPISDAVRNICGAAATVCGVWWPTALGNQQQYDSCMSHHASDSDLQFGESPNEYCSALWAGDCEGVSQQKSLAELCSLVNGNGVQWETRYDFGDFVTWGDCANYKTVDERADNIVGIKLSDAPQLRQPAPEASPTPADLKICAGRLYLLAAP